MAETLSTTSRIATQSDNNVGYGLKTLVLTEELLSNHQLTLIEKLVLSYYEQVSPYAEHYDSCALYLDLSHGDVVRAKTHLVEMGYLEEGDNE